MFVTLRPDVFAAVIEDDLVLLDVTADAYLCLPGAAAEFATGPSRQAALGEALVARGLARATSRLPGHPATRPLPTRDVLRAAGLRPGFGDILRLAAAYADVLLHYRGRSFSHILDRARRGRMGRKRDPADLARLCAVFHTAAPWVPISGKCLERSFCFLRFLQRSGGDADWVFGVATWPFVAHCWLQVGDTALDDAVERLDRYTTIMTA
ncbi:MAG: lasso peptide biosynthesis B2 protein [Phenylobacterium sp.]|uniref:lasso peptide biosynthesis B2 protein n=1 Tax=Phenylobacterium sp. TaxID=1871053 RepID=UPI0025F4D68F|nr:lasso peptide biosynthesis B2 protein [Phenylobacterium sp.]MBI1198528.1 lasso peptide biosynthesis B2 protein [Phenylobacterium sp.]